MGEEFHGVSISYSGLRILRSPDWEYVDTKRRHVYQCADGAQLARDKVGVGLRPNWSMHRPTSPGPCMIFFY